MHHNARGKTLTIFIILVIVLLVSSTSIGFFLYHKESQAREQAESDFAASQATESKLQADLKEAKRQLTVALDKNKEADDKINSLMDDIDLKEGVRTQLKSENDSLKDQMASAKKDQEKVRAELDEAQKRYKEVQGLLKAEQDKSANLQVTIKDLQAAKAKADTDIESMKSDLKAYNQRTPEAQVRPEVLPPSEAAGKSKVELDKIVVNPEDGARGRILSVDKSAEFVVCNLGLKQGIKSGDVLSVYRGEEYLGDVRVSRVQDELSAADIIPPFSSHKVRKNDTVVFKP